MIRDHRNDVASEASNWAAASFASSIKIKKMLNINDVFESDLKMHQINGFIEWMNAWMFEFNEWMCSSVSCVCSTWNMNYDYDSLKIMIW